MRLGEFLRKFRYKADKKDEWNLIHKGPYEGDCEDFSLTVAFIISNKSWLEFWFNSLTLKFVPWFVKTDEGEDHVALWVRGHGWIDNIHPNFGELRHKKKFPYLTPILALTLILKYRKTK